MPRDKLKSMMEFEADRMTGLVLTDDVVRPELKVVLEEQNMRVANNPGARLGEQMDAALYLNHPYGRPIIGWRHEIEKLDREDALAFYRRFYTPNNAVLVIAGDVTADEVRQLAEETYGKVPRVAEVKPRRAPAGAGAGGAAHGDAGRSARRPAQRVSATTWRPRPPPARRARAKRSKCSRTSSAAARTAASIRRWWSTRASRSSAGASYDGTALDTTRSERLRHRRSPERACRSSKRRSTPSSPRSLDKGVTAEELERSKNRMIADAIYAQDNQRTLAQWYGAALMTGSTVEQVRAWPDRIRAVTGRRRARGGAPLARQAPLGHRLSDQGHSARGETLVSAPLCAVSRRALLARRGHRCSRASRWRSPPPRRRP